LEIRIHTVALPFESNLDGPRTHRPERIAEKRVGQDRFGRRQRLAFPGIGVDRRFFPISPETDFPNREQNP
jgi:hypothetical protein